MLTDPIADMLTRIRNANTALKPEVAIPASLLKEEVAKVLVAEGYADGYEVSGEGVDRALTIQLRYTADRTRAISGLRRVSRPGLRVYRKSNNLPRVEGGLGVAVVSTSQGLLPDREARRRKLGGEILCEVW